MVEEEIATDSQHPFIPSGSLRRRKRLGRRGSSTSLLPSASIQPRGQHQDPLLPQSAVEPTHHAHTATIPVPCSGQRSSSIHHPYASSLFHSQHLRQSPTDAKRTSPPPFIDALLSEQQAISHPPQRSSIFLDPSLSSSSRSQQQPVSCGLLADLEPWNTGSLPPPPRSPANSWGRRKAASISAESVANRENCNPKRDLDQSNPSSSGGKEPQQQQQGSLWQRRVVASESTTPLAIGVEKSPFSTLESRRNTVAVPASNSSASRLGWSGVRPYRIPLQNEVAPFLNQPSSLGPVVDQVPGTTAVGDPDPWREVFRHLSPPTSPSLFQPSQQPTGIIGIRRGSGASLILQHLSTSNSRTSSSSKIVSRNLSQQNLRRLNEQQQQQEALKESNRSGSSRNWRRNKPTSTVAVTNTRDDPRRLSRVSAFSSTTENSSVAQPVETIGKRSGSRFKNRLSALFRAKSPGAPGVTGTVSELKNKKQPNHNTSSLRLRQVGKLLQEKNTLFGSGGGGSQAVSSRLPRPTSVATIPATTHHVLENQQPEDDSGIVADTRFESGAGKSSSSKEKKKNSKKEAAGAITPFVRRISLTKRSKAKSSVATDISEDYVEITEDDLGPPASTPAASSKQRHDRVESVASTRSGSTTSVSFLPRSSVASASNATKRSSARTSISDAPTSASMAVAAKPANGMAAAIVHADGANRTKGGPNGPSRAVSMSSPSTSEPRYSTGAMAKVDGKNSSIRQRTYSAAPALAAISSSPSSGSPAPSSVHASAAGSGSLGAGAGQDLSASSSSNTIGRSAGSQIVQNGELQQHPSELSGSSRFDSTSPRKRAQSDAAHPSVRTVFPSEAPLEPSPTKPSRFASIRRLMRGSSSRTKSNPTRPTSASTPRQASLPPTEFGLLEENASDDAQHQGSSSSPATRQATPRQRTKSEARSGFAASIMSPLRSREPPMPKRPAKQVQAQTKEDASEPVPEEQQAASSEPSAASAMFGGLPLSTPTSSSEHPTTPRAALSGLPSQDRSLTLHALQASPSGRRSKDPALRSHEEDSTDAESLLSIGRAAVNMDRRPSQSSNTSSLGVGVAIGAGPNGSTEVLGHFPSGRQPSRLPGFEGSNLLPQSKQSIEQPTIPRMWQAADPTPSHSEAAADCEPTGEASSAFRSGFHQGSVTTASWRTAPSDIAELADSPDKFAAAQNATTHIVGARIPNNPMSQESIPLVELISQFDRRMPSNRSSENDSSVSYRTELESINRSPAIAAGPSPEPVLFPTYAPTVDQSSSVGDSGFATRGSSVSSVKVRKRNTFGGNESLMPTKSSLSSPASPNPSRSRFGELSVSEIESNLAVIEAALNDNSQEGSFDPTNLRRRLGSPAHSSLVTSSFSGGAPTRCTTSYSESPRRSLPSDQERITLRPQSHDAIAHAVREVRRALSSSQLRKIDDDAAEDEEADQVTELSRITTAFHERSPRDTTPARAARIRQESMRDVEETYGRMVNLVTASAGIASPLVQQDDVFDDRAELHETPSRAPRTSLRPASDGLRISHGGDESVVDPGMYTAPGEESSREISDRNAAVKRSSGGSASNRGTSSASPSLAIKTQGTPQSSHSNMAKILADGPQARRSIEQRSNPSAARSSLEARRASYDRLQAIITDRRTDAQNDVLAALPPATASRLRTSSRASGATRQSIDGGVPRARHSSEAPRPSSRYSNGEISVRGFDFADNHTTATSIMGSPLSSHNLTSLQRRHNLEKNSLLDALERAKSEADQYRQQNEQLRTDLHQEVARLLETERAYQMSCAREDELQSKVERLEDQLRAEHEARIDLLEKLERISALWPASSDSTSGGGQDMHGSISQDGTGDMPMASSSAGHAKQNRAAVASTDGGLSSVGTPANHPRQIEPVAASTRSVRVSRILSQSPILTTRISNDDMLISSDASDDEDREMLDHSRTSSTSKNDKRKNRYSTLRSYPSELGLHIDSQEMSWGNLVDEAPPGEESDMARPSRSESSSLAKDTPNVVAEPASVPSPVASAAAVPGSSKMGAPKRRTLLPQPSATTTSIARSVSAAGSMAPPDVTRKSSPQVSATSSVTDGTIASPAIAAVQAVKSRRTLSGSGIPKAPASRLPTSGSAPGMRKVSTQTADSSFTARSSSPVGEFIRERGNKGHYDDRRPEEWNAVQTPGGLDSLIQDDSLEQEIVPPTV